MPTCPACHSVAASGDQFCSQCGASFTTPPARSFGLGRWLLLSPCVLALGVALGVLAASRRKSHDKVEKPYQIVYEMARTAEERQMSARERVHEMAENAVSVPGAVPPLDLRPYEYPGAGTGSYSRIPGNEMMQLRSKDLFDTILQHYQKKLGKPLMLMTDDDDKIAFFPVQRRTRRLRFD